ncbi:MAG: hypothetical protein AB7S38_28070 [Vulcanimicrobiota bacterium]
MSNEPSLRRPWNAPVLTRLDISNTLATNMDTNPGDGGGTAPSYALS